MKADLVLVISPEAPLMKQLGKVLGKMVTPYDFSTIERGEKYITIQHDETGLVVAYTSEERLKRKNELRMKNVLESLKESVKSGKITIREAAIKLHKAGWTSFVDVDKTKQLLEL